MAQWVITGYSHKMDGLLVITEADTAEEALQKTARFQKVKYSKINHEGEVVKVFRLKDTTTEDILNDLVNHETRWWWDGDSRTSHGRTPE